MEEDRLCILNWIKDHKKELIIAGLSVLGIAVIIAAILGARNAQALEQISTSLRRMVEKPSAKPKVTAIPSSDVCIQAEIISNVSDGIITGLRRAPHEVTEHIRNLPKGYNASSEKLVMAVERGIELMPGQTIVTSYRTGVATA